MSDNNSDSRPNGQTRQAAPGQTRQRSSPYPRANLQQCEKLAKIAFDMGPRRCDQDRVAQAVRYKDAKNGAFIGLRASATQFALIEYVGGYISVSEEWINVLNSENPALLAQARRDAICRPDLYKQLIDDYNGRQLPNVERLMRELHLNQKYGILKDAASRAAATFLESANYTGILDAKGFLQFTQESLGDSSGHASQAQHSKHPALPSSRQEEIQRQANPSLDSLADAESLDRIEVQLLNGKKAYLFVPVPLPRVEKERLKQYIDLVLEESPHQHSAQSNNTLAGAGDVHPPTANI